ncbi:MAG: hypothetical protein RR253_03325 [Oscillospiraceae bacterium]
MKKVILCLCAVTLIFFTACGGKTEKLNEFYTIENDSPTDIAAIVFLGRAGDGLERAKKTLGETIFKDIEGNWPKDVAEIATENGDELYLLLPKYEGTKIVINAVVMDDKGELAIKEELINTDKPILLTCNVSDIIPSAQMTVTYGEKTAVIMPGLSLKDGSVLSAEFIYSMNGQENIPVEGENLEASHS